jgi:TetR/AcrR family transcriptional repressor of nem operon
MAHRTIARTIGTRSRKHGTAVDREAVLRKVMDVLSKRGFANASIADLTRATGMSSSMLRRDFGTKDDLFRAAIRACADTEASLAHEPLQVSPTGREAIESMLEENVRLRRHRPKYCGCLFTFNAFVIPPEELELQDLVSERRRSLARHIRLRLVQSVAAGELPGNVNCDLLGDLCFTVLSGLTFRVLEGTPPTALFRSIELFVNALGFAPTRRPVRGRRPPSSTVHHKRRRGFT